MRRHLGLSAEGMMKKLVLRFFWVGEVGDRRPKVRVASFTRHKDASERGINAFMERKNSKLREGLVGSEFSRAPGKARNALL